MKRTIEVKAGRVTVKAVIDTDKTGLTRGEIEKVRDELADNLQSAVSDLRYIGIPRNRVQVV